MEILQEFKNRKYGTLDKFSNCEYESIIKRYTKDIPNNYYQFVKVSERILDYFLDDNESEPISSSTIAFINIFVLRKEDNVVVDSFCAPLIPFTIRTQNELDAVKEIMENFYEDQQVLSEPICTEVLSDEKHNA